MSSELRHPATPAHRTRARPFPSRSASVRLRRAGAFMPTTISPSSYGFGRSNSCARRGRGQMQGVLDSMVIDTAGDHNTQNTARRVAKMYLTRSCWAAAHPPAITEFKRRAFERADDIVARDHRAAPAAQFLPRDRQDLDRRAAQRAPTSSACPSTRPGLGSTGAGRRSRRRLWQLADRSLEKTQPDGQAIVMGGVSHFCMSWRGVRDGASKDVANSGDARRLPHQRHAAPRISALIPGRNQDHAGLACSHVSRAVDTSPAAIEAILTQSRQHNPATGITGVLPAMAAASSCRL